MAAHPEIETAGVRPAIRRLRRTLLASTALAFAGLAMGAGSPANAQPVVLSNGQTYDVGTGSTISALIGAPGSTVTINTGGSQTLTTQTGGASTSFEGTFRDGSNGAVLAIDISIGTLVLTGGNNDVNGVPTFTGGITVNNGGTVVANTSADLGGDNGGGITLDAGTLKFGAPGFTTGQAIKLGAGGGTVETNSFGGTLSGTITDASGTPGSLTINDGTGSNTGIVTLSGTGNTYSGATTVNSGATLQAGATNAFSPNSQHVVNGTLDLNSSSQNIGSLAGGGIVTSGSDGDGQVVTLTTQGDGSTSVFSGVLRDDPGNSTTLALTVTTGTLTLTNINNNYSGGTTVLGGGTLVVTADGVMGTGSLTLGSDPVASQTTGTLQLASGIVGLFQSSRTINLSGIAGSGGGGIFDVNGNTAELDGVIQDAVSGTPGSFTLRDSTGGGVLTLTGTNTYSGGTIIDAGTLKVTSDANLGATYDPSTAPNATLTFGGGTLEIAQTGFSSNRPIFLSHKGAGNTASIVQVDNGVMATLTGTIADGVASPIQLIVNGAGTLVLNPTSGANTYSGGTLIQGNTTVQIAADSSLGDPAGSVTLGSASGSTGTLQLASGISSNRAFFLAGTVGNGGGGIVDVNGNAVTLTGLIQDAPGVVPGSLTVTDTSEGGGVLTLTRTNNSYSGGTTVTSGATLAIAGDGSLGASSGPLTFNEGMLFLNGSLVSGRTINLDNASLVHNSSPGAPFYNQIELNGFNATLSGQLGDDPHAVINFGDPTKLPGSLTITNTAGGPGNSVLTLTGTSNTYQGTTFLGDFVTLRGGATNAFSPNSVIDLEAIASTNATLDLGGFDQRIAGLNGCGCASNVLLGANTLTIATNGNLAPTAFIGAITGTGGVTVTGNGEQDFGKVGYTGPTQIGGSALVVALAKDAFSSSSSLMVGAAASDTATFDMHGRDQTLNALSGVAPGATVTNNTFCGDGCGASPVVLTLGVNGASSSFAGSITDGSTNFGQDNVVSLTKSGAGTFTLAGTNTYTGVTIVGGGTLQVDGTLYAVAGGGGGMAAAAGAGSAVNVLSGATLTGAGTINAAVNVANGGFLAGSSANTLTMGSLVLSNGSVVNTSLGGSGAALFGVASNLTFGTTPASVTLNVINTPLAGVYQIFTYGGTLTNPGGLTPGTVPAGETATINTATANQVNLTLAGAQATLQFWHPSVSGFGGNGTWNASNANWSDQNGQNLAPWGSVEGIFQGTPGTVTVQGSQAFQTLEFVAGGYQLVADTGTPGSGLVTNGTGTLWAEGASTNATIATPIGGSGNITKIGAGTITLTGTNSYSGGTFINAGTLAITQDASLGAAAGGVTLNVGTVTNVTTLQFGASFGLQASRTITLGTSSAMLFDGGLTAFDTQGFNDTIAGNIVDGSGGSGALTKIGTGKLTLSGTNSYSGGTFINGGTLAITQDASLGAAGGGVTLDGGGATLQFAGAFGLQASRRIALAAGTFDTQGFDDSIGGNIVDGIGAEGLLTKIGSGTLTLFGADSYSGPTLVNAGTLQAGAVNVFTPNSVFAIASGATLDLNNFNQTLGSFSGAGSIALGSATLTTGGDSSSQTFSGMITGSGGLTKVGTGSLNFTGTGTYTGTTTINGGILSVNGTLVSPVTVGSGGTLGGSGSVGSTTILAGGTLGPTPGGASASLSSGSMLGSGTSGASAGSFGSFTVNGNLSFAAGSTYAVNVNAQGQNDFTHVTGKTTISGGTVGVLAASGTYQPSTVYKILTSDNGVNGTFSGTTSNLAFLSPTLAYDTNDVFLTLQRNDLNFQIAAQPGNPTVVANALQTAALQFEQQLLFGNGAQVAAALLNGGVLSSAGLTIINRIENLTAANANLAFNSLSGEGANAAPEASFLASRLFSTAMLSQSDFWRNGGGADANGFSSNELGASQALGYAPIDDQHIAPFDKVGGKPMTFAQTPLPRTWRVWFSGLGGLEQLSGDAGLGIAKSSTHAFGGAGGIDYQISSNFLVGFAAGGTNGSFSTNARSTQGTEGGMHIGVYGTANFGQFYATTTLDGGYFDDHLTRSIIGVGPLETANARFTERELGGRLEIGWKQSFGNFKVTPFAALEARHIAMPSFTEETTLLDGTPGILGLGYRSQSVNSVRSHLGANLQMPVDLGNGMEFTPNLRLAWVHEFEPSRQIGAFLVNLPQAAFTVDGARPAREALEASIGAQLGVTQNVKLFANFDGDFYHGGRSYGAMAGLKIIFDDLPRAASPGLAGSAPIFTSRDAAKAEEDTLFPRVVREPQNLDLSFHFAEVASAAGDYEAAVGALERMRFYNAALPRVELELGVLYFRMGSYKMALSHFEAAVASPDTPEEVRRRVAEFEREIEKRLSPNQFTVFAQTGLRYQSNANAGPENVLVKALGQDAVLDSQFTRKADWNAFGLVSARYFYDFGNQRGDGWQTDLSAYYSRQFSVTRLDLGIAELQTGPRLAVAPDALPGLTFHPYVIGNAATLGDHPYLATLGAGAAFDYAIGGDLAVEPSVEFRRREYKNSTDYQSAKDQTGNLVNFGLAATGPVSTSVRWQAKLLYATASANQRFDEYNQFGVDFGLPIDFYSPALLGEPRVWTVTPMAGYSLVRYGGPNVLVDPNVTREDGEWHAGLSIDAPLTSYLGFGAQLMFQRVNSTLRNYDTRNFSISAGPTVRF